MLLRQHPLLPACRASVVLRRSTTARRFAVRRRRSLLMLKGEKRRESEQKDKNYHFSERAYGSFQRAFGLPASVDRDKISADFSKGVLTIEMPKTAEAQRQPKKSSSGRAD